MRLLLPAVIVVATCGTVPAFAETDLTDLRLRMCVAEAGFEPVPDHAAMLHSIDRLGRRAGLSPRQAILDHVSEFKNGLPKRRRWIGRLTTACGRPEGYARRHWPQRQCFELVRRVRLYEAGKLRDPCKGNPDQWRSRRFPKLQRAAARKGWRRIGCGRDTLHVFWSTRGGR